MNNIVRFPGRIQDNKNISTVEFNNWLESCNFPTIIHAVIKALPFSSYLNDFPQQWIDVTSWAQGRDEEIGLDFFVLGSSLRKKVIPQFGTQSYIEYAWVAYEYADEEPESHPTPNTLIDQLRDYVNSYPETICPNASFWYALLSGILEQPDVKFIEGGLVEDRFVVVFYELNPVEGRWLKFSFMADFLPLILDDAAIAFNAPQER